MSAVLHVAHVIHSFRPGGMENGIVNLAHGLLARGIHSHICSLAQPEDQHFLQRLPAQSQIFTCGKTTGIQPRVMHRLHRAIRQLKPTLIHTHNWDGLFYSLPTAWTQRIPLIHGEHAYLADWERQPRRLTLRRWMYQTPAQIHTVSIGQIRELEQRQVLRPGHSTQALPNGVDTQRFSPGDRTTARAALGLPLHTQLIGMVARWVPIKRHHLLLEAFAQIADHLPLAHLVFIGSGGHLEEPTRQAIAAHPFAQRIHCLGHREDMPQVYPALDLVALPSEREGMSNACLEALACAVPVISHDFPGATELITDRSTGRVLPITHSSALADALLDALSGQQLPTWSAAARADVVQRYSLIHMMDRYEALYRSQAPT